MQDCPLNHSGLPGPGVPGMEWVADRTEDGTSPFCLDNRIILCLKGVLEDQLR